MSPPGTGRSKHLGRKVLMVGDVFGRDLSEDFYMIMPKLLHGLVRLGCNLQVFNDREMARGSTPLLRSAAGRAAANRKPIKRSEESRGGKEWGRTCRYGRWEYLKKKKKK